MMLLASAGGNRVPVIAQLVQADEDTVRDVIHRFNEIGMACLDPRWAGGSPSPTPTTATTPCRPGPCTPTWLAQRECPSPRRAGGPAPRARSHPQREGHPLGRTSPRRCR
ncbi:helix-turn-helix domain-containing protein [Microtetraspora fusca]|uniref:Helix-turn-helix domain-containing protein n=1 Tax=Microtetraspora fusca TaxID=1997 RepID=A0ABW6V951_MICFU